MTDCRCGCEAGWILLHPKFFPNQPSIADRCETAFQSACRRLVELPACPHWNDFANIQSVRAELLNAVSTGLSPQAQPVRVAVSVILDLVVQGWKVKVDEQGVAILRPSACHESRVEQKARTKTALLFARDEQLSESSVRQFVHRMETRRRGPGGAWITIRSLIRHGPDLASKLAQAPQGERQEWSPAEWKQVVDPYLQFVTEGSTCPTTGLLLGDIWRYFRCTWLTPSRSTPGRSMRILVRDAASEMHPIIGIAAISSAIVQQTDRDLSIGWEPGLVLANMRKAPTHQDAKWLLDSLSELIAGIRTDDLVTAEEITVPSVAKIQELEAVAKQEMQRHKTSAKGRNYRKTQEGQAWQVLSETPLYRAKRAETLSRLLGIRFSFQVSGFTKASVRRLRLALENAHGREAIAHLVRHVKATSVGIHMMDINVAGSIAPYSTLLGGKLVSLLLASPEVRNYYEGRYGRAPSIIASAMKGTEVIRRPHLVLLCTTGLFAGGSSQYNRIKYMPDAANPSRKVEFLKLDQETSFSTSHLSQRTLTEMKLNEEQWYDGSNVHGIFGEGVNPKMRKLREGLTHLGFPAQKLLQAGSPRSIYLVPLASNFCDILLHRAKRPYYILPHRDPKEATGELAEFWRTRWLRQRVRHIGIIEKVAAESLSHPVSHAAVVRLPTLSEKESEVAVGNEASLFADDVSFTEMF